MSHHNDSSSSCSSASASKTRTDRPLSSVVDSAHLNPEEVVGRALQRLAQTLRVTLERARNKEARNPFWELRSAKFESMNCSELLELICRKKVWYYVMSVLNLSLSADVFEELRSIRRIWGSEVFYQPNSKSYAQHSLMLVFMALKLLGEDPTVLFQLIRDYEWFFEDWDVWQHCRRQFERATQPSALDDVIQDDVDYAVDQSEDLPFSVGVLDRAVVAEIGVGMLHEVDAALIINSSGPEEPIDDIKPQISIMEGFPIEKVFYPKYCISINVPMNTPPHIIRVCYDIGLQAGARNKLRSVILIPSNSLSMEETVVTLKRLSNNCPGIQSVILIPKEHDFRLCKQLLDQNFTQPCRHDKPKTLSDIRIDTQRANIVCIQEISSPCPQFPTLKSVYGANKKKKRNKCILYQIRDALIQLRDEIFGGIRYIDKMDIKHPVNLEVECQRLHDSYTEWSHLQCFEPAIPDVVASEPTPLASSSTQTQKAIVQVADVDIVYDLVLAAEADTSDGKRRTLLDVCMELQERWGVDARSLKFAMQRRLIDAIGLFAEICTGTTPEQAKHLLLTHSSHFIKEILLEAIEICEWTAAEAQRLTMELGPIHDEAFQSILRDKLVNQYGKQMKECPNADNVWNRLASVVVDASKWEHVSEESVKIAVDVQVSPISSPMLSPAPDESDDKFEMPSPPMMEEEVPPATEEEVPPATEEEVPPATTEPGIDDQLVEVSTPKSEYSVESVDTAFSSPLSSPSAKSSDDWELLDDE